jgi:GTP pyrophosphokinase
MLIALPRGATPIDFAYFVHSDVGNTAVGAKINGDHTPLHTPLRNGDQVEIVTSKEQTPSPLWERFVATGRARAEIRRFLRHAQRDQHVKLGRRILEKVFSDEGFEFGEKAVDGVLKKLRVSRPDDVYADVGRGALRADEVIEAVYPELKRRGARKRTASTHEQPVSIEGLTEGIAYRLGGCCHPIPGDRIVGLMVPGEGVIVHTVDCDVLDRHQDSMVDWIDVRWRDRGDHDAYSVARIAVRVENTTGSLASIAHIISRNGANISNLKITDRNPLYFEIQIDLEVRDTQHLEHIVRALKVDTAVEMVERVRGLDTDNSDGPEVRSSPQVQGVLI